MIRPGNVSLYVVGKKFHSESYREGLRETFPDSAPQHACSVIDEPRSGLRDTQRRNVFTVAVMSYLRIGLKPVDPGSYCGGLTFTILGRFNLLCILDLPILSIVFISEVWTKNSRVERGDHKIIQ